MDRTYDIGRVVMSCAGRDLGRLFLILGVADDKFVLIADGEMRKTQVLKKKNIKHIVTKPYIYDKIQNGFVTGSILDAEIRKYLKQLVNDEYSCKEE